MFTTFVKKKLKKISFWDFCFIYINILSSLSISFLTIWNWKVEIPTGVSMGLAEKWVSIRSP